MYKSKDEKKREKSIINVEFQYMKSTCQLIKDSVIKYQCSLVMVHPQLNIKRKKKNVWSQ